MPQPRFCSSEISAIIAAGLAARNPGRARPLLYEGVQLVEHGQHCRWRRRAWQPPFSHGPAGIAGIRPRCRAITAGSDAPGMRVRRHANDPNPSPNSSCSPPISLSLCPRSKSRRLKACRVPWRLPARGADQHCGVRDQRIAAHLVEVKVRIVAFIAVWSGLGRMCRRRHPDAIKCP